MTPPGKEKTTERNRGPIALWRVALLLMFLLTGCRLADVAVSQGKPSAEATAAPPITLRALVSGPDVAVSAVDFVPPLSSNSNVTSGELSLVVAIENKGNRTEQNVRVVAQITDQDEKVLHSEAQTVNSLAAGEGKVVQFGRLSDLPLRPIYIVKVWTVAVSGEEHLDDNMKTFRVPIRLSSR
ncbi:MAG: hypothetical protein Q8R28_19795 [Dehalococcoidia bacterium]|nr:hypothetical protein [Dehalococcoidia bacterium]